MPSRKSRFIMSAFAKNRKLIDVIGDRLMRADVNDPALAALPMLGTSGQAYQVDAIPTLMITPALVTDPDWLILHCHGGAYVAGGLLQARVIASKLSAVTGLKTLTFAYRLAPEHPYPAQLEDAFTIYRHIEALGYDMRRVIFAGESAGGNLAVILALALRQKGLPLPAALMLMSPWADLEQKGDSYETLAQCDVTLNKETIHQSALQYANGHPLDDPMLSTVYADFTGFPPTTIHVGTSEMLLSDAESLYQCMKRDGVQATLVRFEGMCHVFQAYGFLESRLSLKAFGLFVKDILDRDIDRAERLH